MFGWKRSKREEYYNKKSYLNRRLQKDVIRNGTAYLSCRIEGLEDVISKFSIQGTEALNAEFADALVDNIDCIPQEYPLVLEIHGPQFTEEEKKMITEAVISDADYLLGKTEAENNHHRKVFWWMVAGTVGSGALLGVLNHFVDEVPLEFFYVLFWLFADALVRYLFIEFGDYKNDKIRAGRIASIKVVFVESSDE